MKILRSRSLFALALVAAMTTPMLAVTAAETGADGVQVKKLPPTLSVDQVAALATVGTQGAEAQAKGAEITVSGDVTVDGAPATTGGTVFPGSRIKTGKGATATISYNGMRLTILELADGIVTFTDTSMRGDLVCGSATGASVDGSTVQVVTQDDTNVHVGAGAAEVIAESKTTSLATDEQQTFEGSTRVTARGASSFDLATVLCSCKCAVPVVPVIPLVASAGIPAGVIAAIIGGAVTAVVIPPIVNDDPPPISPSSPA
jgi:hypothetical protein